MYIHDGQEFNNGQSKYTGNIVYKTQNEYHIKKKKYKKIKGCSTVTPYVSYKSLAVIYQHVGK